MKTIKKPRITFFCRIKNKKALRQNLFYAQDLDILSGIDPELVIATKWGEIKYSSDVIFIWWWTYAFVPVLLGRLLGKRVIITGTFNYEAPGSPNDFSMRPAWQRMLIWISARCASTNIFVSKREFDIFNEKLQFSNIEYIPHGVYAENYIPVYERNSDFLLTISWLEKSNLQRKCVYTSVDALATLRERGYDLRLVIAGRSGDAELELKEYIKAANLESHIEVLVDITETKKIELLSSCKIYLQPTIYEGFGVAIAEAMSCGCAIVTSDAGEVPNVVGDAAVVLDKTTPSTIAEAVVDLINDPHDYEKYQRKARQRLTDLFLVERRRAAIVDLLERTV
ncbi:glycosyltransferase family 4 protein [Aggregatimonas sangjinii]|uniref:Glycosyltransferase family 4 protein n=1 Tax=Aggregatimonas sangjinii TaxID=2583587 RepID=A0A5B7STI8_9FLAO|nr:glycosyltransferase family 4 protein [Aggregatimonas sangjinii]QCX01857.1 glycosyltransferase family 4 protein [Aggregatimonas sangjinii]